MSRGIDLERRVRGWLEDEGWVVIRAAGSLGIADLVALREEADGDGVTASAMLVEVKGDKGSPFTHFGPAKQRAITNAARQAGAEAWLCHIPPRAREPKWISSEEFPTNRRST